MFNNRNIFLFLYICFYFFFCKTIFLIFNLKINEYEKIFALLIRHHPLANFLNLILFRLSFYTIQAHS